MIPSSAPLQGDKAELPLPVAQAVSAEKTQAPEIEQLSGKQPLLSPQLEKELIQRKVWLNLLPKLMELLQLPSVVKKLTIREAITYVLLTLLSDLMALNCFNDKEMWELLKMAVYFKSNPYEGLSLPLLDHLFQVIEARAPKEFHSNPPYKSRKQFLIKFMKTPGCQGHASDPIHDLMTGSRSNNKMPALEPSLKEMHSVLSSLNRLFHKWIVNVDRCLINIDNAINLLHLESTTTIAALSSSKIQDIKPTLSLMKARYHKHKEQFTSHVRILLSLFSRQNAFALRCLPQLVVEFEKNQKDWRKSCLPLLISLMELSSAHPTQADERIEQMVNATLLARGCPQAGVDMMRHLSNVSHFEKSASEEDKKKPGYNATKKWVQMRDQLRLEMAVEDKSQKKDLNTQQRQILNNIQTGRKHVPSSETVHDLLQPVYEAASHAALSINLLLQSLEYLSPVLALLKAKALSLAPQHEAAAQASLQAIYSEEQEITGPCETNESDLNQELEQLFTDSAEDAEESLIPPAKPELPKVDQDPQLWRRFRSQVCGEDVLRIWSGKVLSKQDEYYPALCLRHTAYHISVLQSQVNLLKQVPEVRLNEWLPLFVFMFTRSCSLITEQYISAFACLKVRHDTLSHYHLELMQQCGINKGIKLLSILNGGEIFHRYPHKCALRLEMQPESLLWLIRSNACTPQDLIRLAHDTIDFIRQMLPENHRVSSTARALQESIHATANSSASEQPPIDLVNARFKFSHCIDLVDKRIAKEQKPLLLAHWKDVKLLLRELVLSIDCLHAYPQTNTFLAQGDAILTLLQFLDEQIEEGLFLDTNGFLLGSHDLELYRQQRHHPIEEGERLLLNDLNIESGAHYLHRYCKIKGYVPRAISWRLNCEKAARFHRPNDELHAELHNWMNGIADLSVKRLTAQFLTWSSHLL